MSRFEASQWSWAPGDKPKCGDFREFSRCGPTAVRKLRRRHRCGSKSWSTSHRPRSALRLNNHPDPQCLPREERGAVSLFTGSTEWCGCWRCATRFPRSAMEDCYGPGASCTNAVPARWRVRRAPPDPTWVPSPPQIQRRNRGAMIEPVWLGTQDTRPQMKIREWREPVPIFFPWGAPADQVLVRVIGNQNSGRMPRVAVFIDKIHA
jgi:hypothetical protein